MVQNTTVTSLMVNSRRLRRGSQPLSNDKIRASPPTTKSEGDAQLNQIKSNRSIASLDNPVIQTDIADVLGQINPTLDKIDDRLGKLEVGQAEIKGDVKSIDERLSGQIKNTDEKLSGQIKALDTKVEQLDKRVGNQEFTPIRVQANRGVLIGLIVVILGGAAKFFGVVGNP